MCFLPLEREAISNEIGRMEKFPVVDWHPKWYHEIFACVYIIYCLFICLSTYLTTQILPNI